MIDRDRLLVDLINVEAGGRQTNCGGSGGIGYVPEIQEIEG